MMHRTFILIVLFLSYSGGALRADRDDDSIAFLLKKSALVIEGTIQDEPMSLFSESGVISYVINLEHTKSLSGLPVPAKLAFSADRFYDSEKDALPYLKKGQRCIIFLVIKPKNTPIYHTSDMWLSILSHSTPLERRIIHLANQR